MFSFQLTFENRHSTKKWKMAPVTAIHQNESRMPPSNYRPIPLTCICCKLLENVIVHNLHGQVDDAFDAVNYSRLKSKKITIL